MNANLTIHVNNLIVAIANRHDALTAGKAIYQLSMNSLELDACERQQLRQFIRDATGHKWHHSNIPHRLVKIGRAARNLQVV